MMVKTTTIQTARGTYRFTLYESMAESKTTQARASMRTRAGDPSEFHARMLECVNNVSNNAERVGKIKQVAITINLLLEEQSQPSRNDEFAPRYLNEKPPVKGQHQYKSDPMNAMDAFRCSMSC